MIFPYDFGNMGKLENGKETERTFDHKTAKLKVILSRDNKGRFSFYVYRKINDEFALIYKHLRIGDAKILNIAWRAFIEDELDGLVKKPR